MCSKAGFLSEFYLFQAYDDAADPEPASYGSYDASADPEPFGYNQQPAYDSDQSASSYYGGQSGSYYNQNGGSYSSGSAGYDETVVYDLSADPEPASYASGTIHIYFTYRDINLLRDNAMDNKFMYIP